MDAFVKHASEPGQAGVRAEPDPKPGPGEVLLRVAACGICGSDLHAFNSDPGFEWVEPPRIMGHEFSGTVEQVGDGVTGIKTGEVVVAVSIQGCLECPVCRSGDVHLCPHRRIIGLSYNGGLAEWVVVPASYLVKVPAGLDARDAALAEPLSVAVHAVQRRSTIHPGDNVVVSGPGPIGLLCGQLARLAGADVLMLGTAADSARRLPLAGELGMRTADAADIEGPDDLRAEFGGRTADVWIEASGAGPALLGALRCVRRGGIVTVVSLFAGPVTFVPTDAVRAELTVNFSYASSFPDYERALELLAAGDVSLDGVIDRFPLADAGAAFAAAREGRAVKPLIVPGADL